MIDYQLGSWYNNWHMNVSLVSITQPFIADIKSPEDIVAYCARVSNPTNQLNSETAPNLLKFLIKHKHWSPFEMVDMTMQIKTSRAIAAQILRHRSFSFQEFSQRYSEIQDLEPLQIRKQAKKNRQSSREPLEDALLITKIREHMGKSVSLYKNLIKAGAAKESARMILPLNTQTTMYMKGSLRSWIHYIELRIEENTQKEHRDIAEACKNIFKENLPIVSKALWN